MNKDSIFILLDTFMSEYGWEFDSALKFVTKTPMDVVLKLQKTLQDRKQQEYKLQTKLTAIASATAFGGKDSFRELDKLFDTQAEEIKSEDLNNQVRTLWLKMGKDPKKLEEQIKNKKVTF